MMNRCCIKIARQTTKTAIVDTVKLLPIAGTLSRTSYLQNSYSGRRRLYGCTSSSALPMKAGTELKTLGIFKGQDTPITLERSEYPNWINTLSQPLASLATLRKIPNEEAELDQIKRYLKLTRRQAVRQRNEESAS